MVAHKGAISFGLVYIPVSLYTATQDSDVSFNQLHKEDNSRIRYKKTCSHCGKEVEAKDIVKGFQYEKDSYVIITDQEIEQLKTEKDKTIHILQFSNLSEISPVYYDKAYHAIADKGGSKALELLRASMMEMQKVAVGKSVFGSNEKLLLIIPREDGVLIQTLNYEEDIKEMPLKANPPDINKSELTIAKQLIESMQESFVPSKFKNEFQDKLKNLINSKIEGKEIKKPRPQHSEKIIDLMDALRASVKLSEGKSRTKNASGAIKNKENKDKSSAKAPKKRQAKTPQKDSTLLPRKKA